MKKLTWLLLLLSTAVSADPFIATYKGFYDRLKVVNKGQYQYADVGFYLIDQHKQPCVLKSGEIMTEKQSFSLIFTEQGQLLLPFDEQLKKDKAVIKALPVNPQSQCALTMKIEAKGEFNAQMSQQQLYAIHHEFEQLLKDLSGFFIGKLMGFLLPDQQGVFVYFSGETSKEKPHCSESMLTPRCALAVEPNWQESQKTVTFSQAPVRFTPWIVK